jgi:hypothetical protein
LSFLLAFFEALRDLAVAITAAADAASGIVPVVVLAVVVAAVAACPANVSAVCSGGEGAAGVLGCMITKQHMIEQ